MMKIMGSDGIERDINEHYDCISDVKDDPTGARLAIQDLWAEIERLTSLVSEFSKQAELDASEVSRLIIECNSTPHSEEQENDE
jgi:hypothetical protein